MGIGPITNIIPLPVTQPGGTDFQLSPMARVENSARTQDETYSPSNGRSASGQEDDSEKQPDESESDLEDSSVASVEDEKINLFA